MLLSLIRAILDFKINFPTSPSAGLPWALSVERRSFKEGHLAVFLHLSFIDSFTWSVATTYEIRLLNSNPGCGDVVKTEFHIFRSHNDLRCYGWSNFITMNRLRTGSFIQDDTIKLRVHLKVPHIFCSKPMWFGRVSCREKGWVEFRCKNQLQNGAWDRLFFEFQK